MSSLEILTSEIKDKYKTWSNPQRVDPSVSNKKNKKYHTSIFSRRKEKRNQTKVKTESSQNVKLR